MSSQIFYETALNYNTNDDIQLTFFTNEVQYCEVCMLLKFQCDVIIFNRMVRTILVFFGTIFSSELLCSVCPTKMTMLFSNGTGGWSTEGLTLVAVDKLEHRVVCNSSHLTSFAVLVIVSNNTQVYHGPYVCVCSNDGCACVSQFTPEEEIALSAITYIGCVVSAFFLVITIVVLLACKSVLYYWHATVRVYCCCRKPLNKGSLLYIHLNFCISLLLAQVVFLSGIQTAVPIRVCKIFYSLILH